MPDGSHYWSRSWTGGDLGGWVPSSFNNKFKSAGDPYWDLSRCNLNLIHIRSEGSGRDLGSESEILDPRWLSGFQFVRSVTIFFGVWKLLWGSGATFNTIFALNDNRCDNAPIELNRFLVYCCYIPFLYQTSSNASKFLSNCSYLALSFDLGSIPAQFILK